MGLGLTIARMVAESHGGALDIDGAFGLGTTVSIYLPNAEARYAAEGRLEILAHGVIAAHAPAPHSARGACRPRLTGVRALPRSHRRGRAKSR